MLGSEKEYLTGVLTILIGPQTGCSIVVTMSLASTNQPQDVRPKLGLSRKLFARFLHTMFMIHSALNVIHGGIWHSATLEHLQPFIRRLFACFCIDESLEQDSVVDAVAVGYEARVQRPFWSAQAVAQDAEEAIVASAE